TEAFGKLARAIRAGSFVAMRQEKQERRLQRSFFFFSSRRRHTRWPRDWSSDVCSSDLTRVISCRRARRSSAGVAARRPTTFTRRSEERRVGKECRSRWLPEH